MAHGAHCGQVLSQICSYVVPSLIIVPVRQHDHEMLLHIRQDAMHLKQIARMLAHRHETNSKHAKQSCLKRTQYIIITRQCQHMYTATKAQKA